MTKRRNPFDDTHFLQKMHIGVKEVNLGVNHVENMKKVYEDTMKMLYNGSLKNGILKNQNPKLAVLNGSSTVENGLSTFQHSIPLNQNGLSIHERGGLFQNNMLPVQNRNGYEHLLQKMSQKETLTVDKKDKAKVMNHCCASNIQRCCSFCERLICPTCYRICQKCSNEFCHLCSILQYDSLEETAVCLSCI